MRWQAPIWPARRQGQEIKRAILDALGVRNERMLDPEQQVWLDEIMRGMNGFAALTMREQAPLGRDDLDGSGLHGVSQKHRPCFRFSGGLLSVLENFLRYGVIGSFPLAGRLPPNSKLDLDRVAIDIPLAAGVVEDMHDTLLGSPPELD